jgi:hypothetical protein
MGAVENSHQQHTLTFCFCQLVATAGTRNHDLRHINAMLKPQGQVPPHHNISFLISVVLFAAILVSLQIGPGGSINAMKFWPWDNDLVLTASVDGRVTLNDFENKKTRVLSDTMSSTE